MVAWLSDPTSAVVFASLWWLFLVAALWEGVWKGIALWKSGRNNQVAWFVCIFIFNTMGILPILYLLFFQKEESKRSVRKSAPRTRSRSKKRR